MSIHDDRASELLMKATAQKRAGDLDGAIASLKAAYTEMSRGELAYGIDSYIRLPQFLDVAGRSSEAWREFNRLLFRGYPNQLRSEEIVPMERSKLLDKMRLFLQREQQDSRAAVFAHFSDVSWLIGLYRQDRHEELRRYDAECATRLVQDLNHYECDGCIKELAQAIADEFARYPSVDYAQLGKRFDAILQKASKEE